MRIVISAITAKFELKFSVHSVNKYFRGVTVMVTKRKLPQSNGSKAATPRGIRTSRRRTIEKCKTTPAGRPQPAKESKKVQSRYSGQQKAKNDSKPTRESTRLNFSSPADSTAAIPRQRLLKVAPSDYDVKVMPKDAYEFSETDDFITSNDKYHLKKSSSSSAKHTTQKGKTKVQKSTTSVKTNCKTLTVKGKQSEGRKQTSTPVGSDSRKKALPLKPKQQGQILGKRRSPRGAPALLDISVTPILPVPASLSPKRRRPNGYDPQNDSYIPPLVLSETKSKRSSPSVIAPSGAKGRPVCSIRNQPMKSPVCTPRSVTSSSSSSEKLHVKRKLRRSAQLSHDCKSAGGEKPSSQTTKGTKRKAAAKSGSNQKVSKLSMENSKPNGIRSKVKDFSSKSVSPAVSKTGTIRNAPGSVAIPSQKRQTASAVSTLGHQRKSVWEPGSEEMYCLSVSNDSGISLGSELSSSTSSPELGSFPGFMEDEPLARPSQDLSFSPPPSTSTSTVSKDPESSLNKSISKSYQPNKTGKIRREKGRHSTTRLDAWASQINQDMEDAESFELFIEG